MIYFYLKNKFKRNKKYKLCSCNNFRIMPANLRNDEGKCPYNDFKDYENHKCYYK